MLTLPKADSGDNNLYCCINVCKNYKDPLAKVDLYPLPDNIYEKSLWCKVLNIPTSVALLPTARVCGLHFRYKYFLNQKEQPAASNQSVPLTFIVNNNNQSLLQPSNTSSPPLQIVNKSGFRLVNSTAIPGKVLKAFVYSPNAQQTSSSSVSKNVLENQVSWGSAATLTNLLVKGELMLECQEETLSQAQLSAKESEWDEFIKQVENVQPNTPQSSESLTPISEQNTVKSTNYQVGIPISLPSSSLGSTYITIPSSNASISPNVNSVVSNEPKILSNIVNSSSATGPQYIAINSQNSLSGGSVTNVSLPPPVVQIQSPSIQVSSGSIQVLNSTSINTSGNIQILNNQPVNPPGNIQILNAPPVNPPGNIQILTAPPVNPPGNIQILNPPPIIGPQILQIGNQNIQFYTSNVNFQNSAGGLSFVSNPNSLLLNNQITSSSGINNATIGNISDNSMTLNDNIVSLPAVLQSNDILKAEVFPVLLEKVDEESENNKDVKTASSEAILPLLPKEENVESVVSGTASSNESVIFSELAKSSTGDSKEICADEIDLSNVTAVYGSECMPLSTATEQKSIFLPQTILNGEQYEIITENQSNNTTGSGASILRKYFDQKKAQEVVFASVPAPKPLPPYPTSSIGPVIVDVMSAKEGGQALYTSDELPKIISENTRKAEALKEKNVAVGENEKTEKTVNVVKSGPTQPPAQQQNSSILHSFPKVMHAHSIFSLQKSIPVIPLKGDANLDTRKFFSIKTYPRDMSIEAQHLRERLKNEDFITNPVWWLSKRNCLPMNTPCKLCGGVEFQVDRNKQFFDSYCWTCRNEKCAFQDVVRRPKFFANFRSYSLKDLLLLTYHWATQSDIEEILIDVKMDVEDIWKFFSALQKLCHDTVEKCPKLGVCSTSRIETGVVKLGNYFILGAYERFNRNTRLQAISIEKAFETSEHLKLLENWIGPGSIIISESKIAQQFLPKRYKVSSDPEFTDPKSHGYHILNIARYLVKNMISMFGKLKFSMLPEEVIQGYLDELQWRDRFGKHIETAFHNIIREICKLNDPIQVSVDVILGDVDGDPNDVLIEPSRWVTQRKNYAKSIKSLNEKNAALDDDVCEIVAVKDFKQIEIEVNQREIMEKGYAKRSDQLKIFKPAPGSSIATLNTLFQDIPEIPGGDTNITPKALINVRILLDEDPVYLEKYKKDSTCLGLRLSAEGFINSPVRWLVKKGFVRNKAPCYVCQGTSYLRDNPKYEDGCSWSCQNRECKFENIFKRPHFYARFPMIPMDHLSAMVFHWTVHSDISRITTDAPMDISRLAHVWRSFQVLCSTSLRRKKLKLGGEQEVVEIAMVQYGKLYVLGAMERKTKFSLLKTFFVEPPGQIPVLLKLLSQWIVPNSFVVVNGSKSFQSGFMPNEYNVVMADTSVTEPDDPGFHVLNITSYLLKHISYMFGHFKAEDVRAEVLQVHLDELMWRERFGRMPTVTFYNILRDIFDLETKGYYTLHANQSSSDAESKKNNDNNQKNEDVCMYDKLAVHTEKNENSRGSSDVIQILKSEKVIDPRSLPAVHVVLKRVSKEVLKYYNCWPPAAVSTEEIVPENKNSQLISNKKDLDDIFFQPLCKPQFCLKNQRTYAKNKTQSEPSKPQTNVSPIQQNITVKKRLKEESSDNEDSEIDVCTVDDNSPKHLKPSISNSVIHNRKSNSMVHNRKSCKKTSKKRKKAQKRNEIVVKTEPIDKIEPETVEENENKVKKPICIECGKSVTVDHFMKQFLCMDCKKSVYTTSCCNSFMEHRGYLLFGKRMPRRNTSENYGLHRILTLKDTYYCLCGYTSNIGNKLASHMVACGKTTCYYHAEIS